MIPLASRCRNFFEWALDPSRIAVSLSYRLLLLARLLVLPLERLRYACVRPKAHFRFCVISRERHASASALRCLDSVLVQDYPEDKYRHIFIDDASEDDTASLVEEWLEQHPKAPVTFISQKKRLSGTHNTLEALRKVQDDEIVVELNGDDWLPDRGVLQFLNRVYQDADVWLTYNSCRVSGSWRVMSPFGYSRATRKKRRWRADAFHCRHLRTFRKTLWRHYDEARLIDPETGDYWDSADDVEIYCSLLELAGEHTRQIFRTTCVYNFHEQTTHKKDRAGQLNKSRRIRELPPLEPLERL